MIGVKHSTTNADFGAPIGWNQAELPCDSLPVTRTTYGGLRCLDSYWKPYPDELTILNNGGFVHLHIMGEGMPPVAIGVSNKE